jgi:hypothetical protein
MAVRTIEQIIKDVHIDFKSEYLTNRRKQVTKSMDYYTNNNTDQYISGYFDSESLREIPVFKMNFVKKFVKKMSGVYKLNPSRVGGEIYRGAIANKDRYNKELERLTNLNGSMATVIGMEDGVFNYTPITFYDVINENDDIRKPVALIYPERQIIENPVRGAKDVYVYIDEKSLIRFVEDGQILTNTPHGLGTFPVVFTHDEELVDLPYSNGAVDAISSNEQVNIALTELGLGLRFLMFGQPWMMTDSPDQKKLKMGSDRIIRGGSKDKFGIANAGGDLPGTIEAVKFLIEAFAVSRQMWVQWSNEGGEVPSGVSLNIKDFERLDDYVDDFARWEGYENIFFGKEQIIGKNKGVNIGNEFFVNFTEKEYPNSPSEQTVKDTFELTNGLVSIIDLKMRMDKNIDEVEAERLIVENQAINERLNVKAIENPMADNRMQQEDEDEDVKDEE